MRREECPKNMQMSRLLLGLSFLGDLRAGGTLQLHTSKEAGTLTLPTIILGESVSLPQDCPAKRQ